MAAFKWDGRASVAENASRRLPEAAREYFATGRTLAAGEVPAAENLHAFRLHTKRFRYTLEMFREVYGEPLEAHLDALRQVQTFLGDINDCATTRMFLLEAMPSPSDERRRIESALDSRMKELAAQFIDYWGREFAPESQEQRWLEFLAQAPGDRPKPRAVVRRPSHNRAVPA
jgi:CHAD domain-containing protein